MPTRSLPIPRLPLAAAPRPRSRMLPASARKSPSSATSWPTDWAIVRTQIEQHLRRQPLEEGDLLIEGIRMLLEAAKAGWPRAQARKQLPRLASKLQRLVGDHPEKVHQLEGVLDHLLEESTDAARNTERERERERESTKGVPHRRKGA